MAGTEGERGCATCFEVEDHGPGINPQVRDKIFEPFVRGAAFDAGGATGSGLGLAVVRRLVQLMRGQVSVRCAQPRGAIFAVVLPLPPAAAPSKPG